MQNFILKSNGNCVENSPIPFVTITDNKGNKTEIPVNDNTELIFNHKKKNENKQEDPKTESQQVTKENIKQKSELKFHYIDPPYVGANQGHYGGYTQEHFEELLITLSQCKGKFLLSSYHNEALTTFVKEFGWYQKEITLHLGSSKTKGKKRVEVLTANYPI